MQRSKRVLRYVLVLLLLMVCMMLTLGVNLAANTQHQVITDRLIDHLYPARSEANRILRLALTIDDNGAQYLLSYDPHQQSQLLQTYQQDVQGLRVAVAKLTAIADTPEQRSAMEDFTQFFFGNGGYYALNQQALPSKSVEGCILPVRLA